MPAAVSWPVVHGVGNGIAFMCDRYGPQTLLGWCRFLPCCTVLCMCNSGHMHTTACIKSAILVEEWGFNVQAQAGQCTVTTAVLLQKPMLAGTLATLQYWV